MTFRNPVIKPQNTVRATAVLVVIGPSLALLTPPPAALPFNNSQAWGKVQSVVSAAPQPQSYNPNLYPPPAPPAAPFIPPLFPPTAQVAGQAPQPFVYNQGLYQQTIVPTSVLASGVFAPRTLPPAQPYNLNLYAPVVTPAPFAQYDWSRPFTTVRSTPFTPSYNPNLYVVAPIAPPFAQYDWSRSVAVARNPTPITGRNPLLYSEVPFFQSAWPSTRPIQPATAQQSPNLNITGAVVVTAPFAQYNWPPTFRVQTTLRDNSVSTPLALYGLNPLPFALYDWSRPTKPAVSVSYAPQNPITITTPPPPASTLIQRTLTGVGL